MFDWLRTNQELLQILGIASLVIFVASLILVPVLIVCMPQYYFVRKRGREDSRHPVVRALVLGLKNVVGGGLVLAGIAMLALPGQGILTILLGLGLMNFPGKRRLELRIVRQRPIQRALDWIRARWKRPPLELP